MNVRRELITVRNVKLKSKKGLALGILILLMMPNYLQQSFSTNAELLYIAENYESVYTVLQTGNLVRKLYISITPSLYDYYKGKDHSFYNVVSYNKFITPEVVKPIAKELRKVFKDNEQFANAVLSFVHKMKYIRSGPKYPVEILVENAGDCSALSFLAASIMIAGGLDVVLLRYSGAGVEHLNVGISLSRTPIYHTWWIRPKSFEHGGRKYWMAECTPSWIDWRVGDEPESLLGMNVTIIPVNPCDESPSCVSASLDFPLKPSAISIDLPPQTLVTKNGVYSLQISGTVTPINTGTKVVAYVRRNDFSWEFYLANLDELGRYTTIYNLTSPGTYYIKVSRNGCEGYSGADSSVLVLFVGPSSLIQFPGPGFNYTYGPYVLFEYEIYKGIGTGEFLNFQLTGNKILIKGEFILLKGEPMLESWMAPSMLRDLIPLRLPNDFNLQVRDTFALILSKDDGNFTLYVRGLNRYEIFNMSQINYGETLMFNVSSYVRDNYWHSFSLKAEGNVTIFQLYGENSTELEVNQTYNCACKTFVFILANIKNSLIVFKNLRIETYDGSLQLPRNYFTQSIILIYVVLLMSLNTLALVAVIINVYKKKYKTLNAHS
jgi:hypothetical protein